MKENLNLDKIEFKKFFTTDGKLPCIHSEFLMKGSLGKADIFITCKDNYNTFFKENKISICLEEGLKLFSDTKKYKLFLKEFKEYLDKANNEIIPKFSTIPKEMTQQELIDTFKFLSKFWYLYGYTEFPYLDLAYKVSKEQNNKEMENNLDEFSRFKFKAREVLNHYFFKNGVNDNILAYLSKRFNVKARYLFVDELLSLYAGKNNLKDLAEEREKCYSCAIIKGKIIVFPYKKALELNKEFTRLEEKDEIKGIIASKGIAKGKAIICPMLTSHKEIAELDKIMKKGNILIAESTSPDTMVLCNKAAAIVAEQSGLLSHAAVISRELKIPCILQATNATRIIKTGDLVEVDANKGIVKIIKRN